MSEAPPCRHVWIAPTVSWLASLIAGCGAAAILAIGPAWACTPAQGSIKASPSSGASGVSTTVTGSGFPAQSVEIRWNSPAGPLLATTSGPTFSAAVTIPGASPGAYYLIAQSRDALGSVTSSSSVPFQVTEPVTTTTTAPLSQTSSAGQAPATGASSAGTTANAGSTQGSEMPASTTSTTHGPPAEASQASTLAPTPDATGVASTRANAAGATTTTVAAPMRAAKAVAVVAPAAEPLVATDAPTVDASGVATDAVPVSSEAALAPAGWPEIGKTKISQSAARSGTANAEALTKMTATLMVMACVLLVCRRLRRGSKPEHE